MYYLFTHINIIKAIELKFVGYIKLKSLFNVNENYDVYSVCWLNVSAEKKTQFCVQAAELFD